MLFATPMNSVCKSIRFTSSEGAVPCLKLSKLKFLVALTLLGAIAPSPTVAQISPAADGTGTIAPLNGNQFNITGGTQAGSNLFHSFQQFGLNPNQTANFVTTPAIQNVLGRVVGGSPSVINGLIQVTGGNANLYLINPAGIVFGPSASLNVPAAFTATTATAIGFGNQWFSANGSNNYAVLLGNPGSFAFAVTQPGAIVNAGNLAVGQGQNLALLAGTVVNTGTLTAPEGQITVMAVPGSSLVRLSQPGSLLSLEIQPIAPTSALSPATLPELLTIGNPQGATGLAVNGSGQVLLTNSGAVVPSEPGSAIVSGSVNVAGQNGGRVQVLGTQVGLIGAAIDATGSSNGGTVLIGGDYQGKGTVPNAVRTYVSADSSIRSDSLLNGNGGRAIVWADGATEFYGTISARGGSQAGNGGFAEVSGKQNLLFRGQVDLNASRGLPGTLLLDPQNINIVAGVGTNDVELADGSIFPPDGGVADFQIGAGTLAGITGNLRLEATRDINLSTSLTLPGTAGTTITFKADGSFKGTDQDITAPGRNIDISGIEGISVANLNTRGGAGAGGAVTLTADRGLISVASIATTADTGGLPNLNPSGSVKITNKQGAIDIVGSITAGTNQGNGGTIDLEAGGDIKTAQIENQPTSPIGNSGTITIVSHDGSINTNRSGINPVSGTSESGISSGGGGFSSNEVYLQALNGNITTGAINSKATTTAGGITLESRDAITTGAINSEAINAGRITLESKSGSITTGALSSASTGAGDGGFHYG